MIRATQRLHLLASALALAAAACGRAAAPASTASSTPAPRPSILLITLDTTRADAIGPGAAGITTPGFNAVAARGRRFLQAYATVPETLPSLLYQSTMHVPLIVAGPGVEPGSSVVPVSARRVFHTVLDFAGLGSDHTLRAADSKLPEVVLGEAMKPFLEYGWQPQIMAVAGAQNGDPVADHRGLRPRCGPGSSPVGSDRTRVDSLRGGEVR